MTRLTRAGVLSGLVVGVLLGGWPPVSARQAAAPPKPGASSRQAVTEMDVNGLKVLVKERPGSLTVAAGLFIRGGSRNITPANAGIEALMLAVATEATVNVPREQFRRQLARTGTLVGSGINRDYSAFTLGCTREHFDEAWALFADAAMHPSFDPVDFDLIKTRHLIALKSQADTPDAALQAQVSRVVYAGHPYANDPNGTTESVQSLTVGDLKRFHGQVMQTSQLLLVIVGDLTADAVRKRVEASLGKLPRGQYADTPVAPLAFAAPTLSVTAKALPTNYVQGIYAAPPPSSPDIYPLRVANAILRGLVYNEVREKRALSYAPDASLGSASANTGGIYVTAVDANQAVGVMLAQINLLRSSEVIREAITGTAQDFLTQYYMGEQTNGAQTGSLAIAELVGGGWRTADEFMNRIRAVTPTDVRRAANTYMRSLQFVVIGDPAKIDRRVFLQERGPEASAPLRFAPVAPSRRPAS
jgi:zinc protease